MLYHSVATKRKVIYNEAESSGGSERNRDEKLDSFFVSPSLRACLQFITRTFDQQARHNTYLCWQDDERHTNHYHHVELRRPNVWYKIPVADGRKRNDDVIGRLEEIQMTMSCPLKMLNPAHAETSTKLTRYP